MSRILFAGMAVVISASSLVAGEGQLFEQQISASDDPAQLNIPVTYDLWLPEGIEQVRGLIVHQHGCGEGASNGGQTAANDLHWQMLAAKWNCGLVGSSYGLTDDCSQWSDPAKGSADSFEAALDAFSKQTGHPEIATAPWCLWGHSGGAVWAFRMFERQPERSIAVFVRSGRPTDFSDPQELGNVTPLTNAKRQVPIIANLGLKERDHERFSRSWQATQKWFQKWSQEGAPVAFAPDPLTTHECGNSRFLAIPFFDACLAMRLPLSGGGELRPLDRDQAWLGDWETTDIAPAEGTTDTQGVKSFFPNEQVARIWKQFVATGAVEDVTPPSDSPVTTAVPVNHQSIRLTWTAEPDFESGLQGFVISRNGQEIARVMHEKPPRHGLPQFQQLSYHDTPELPLPKMMFLDENLEPSTSYTYTVTALNGYGLASEPSEPVKATTAKLVTFDEPLKRRRPEAELPDGVEANLDLPFATYGKRTMELDLFRPGGDKVLPAIVVIHGGGWINGDRTKFRPLAQSLASKGFVVAAISYRLADEAQFPAAIQDCKASVRWLRANAETYHIDPEHIGVVGGSAGGHLAALLATSHGEKSHEGQGGHSDESSDVQACVVLGGPVDLESESIVERTRTQKQDSNAIKFLGAGYDDDPAAYRAASPLHFLSQDDPSFLFLDGELDQPGKRYADFIGKLDKLGIAHETIIYQHGKHGCWNTEPWFTPMADAMAAYFDRTLRPK